MQNDDELVREKKLKLSKSLDQQINSLKCYKDCFYYMSNRGIYYQNKLKLSLGADHLLVPYIKHFFKKNRDLELDF